MDIKETIINKVLARIPAYLNPVDFLCDVLDISKESVYRRIKGEVSFTLEDMIKISSRLYISLDEIIYANQGGELGEQPIVFQSRSDQLFDPRKTFVEFLTAYIQNMEKISKEENVEIMVAANRLMILTSVSYDYLFKFYYYKWVHQTQLKPLNFSLSDAVLSDDIIALRDKLKEYPSIGTHTYVIDNYFLKNTIREIQYYYNRQLISENEMLLLQKDLYKFVDVMEYILHQKTEKELCAKYIYLSTTQIESSGLYYKYGDKQMINLWISYGINIRSDHPRICNTYYSWFNSLKKFSSLISGCDEFLQTKFISRQRTYIREIMNKDHFYE